VIELGEASLFDVLPGYVGTDEDMIAICVALDPELREVSAVIAEAIILPNIDALPEWVCNELGWAMRLDELQVWDMATVEGKRAILRGALKWRRASGTKGAVAKVFGLTQTDGRIIEWFEEDPAYANPFTFRMRITVTAATPSLTLAQLRVIPEWVRRFGRPSAQLAELAVEVEIAGPLDIRPVLTSGWLIDISFGG
jgi:phage tail P2-like protein